MSKWAGIVPIPAHFRYIKDTFKMSVFIAAWNKHQSISKTLLLHQYITWRYVYPAGIPYITVVHNFPQKRKKCRACGITGQRDKTRILHVFNLFLNEFKMAVMAQIHTYAVQVYLLNEKSVNVRNYRVVFMCNHEALFKISIWFPDAYNENI